MPITREDVEKAEAGDCFVGKEAVRWEILSKWFGEGDIFCFSVRMPNSPPRHIFYDNKEGIFRNLGRSRFALDDLNHPKSRLEQKRKTQALI